MKYLYYPDTLRYAGIAPDDSTVPFCVNTAPPVNPDPDSVVVADPANGSWVARPMNALEIAAAQDAAVARLQAGYQRDIAGGFASSALGAIHTYSAAAADVDKLHQAVTTASLPIIPDGWLMPYLCADDTGTWALVPHTAAQIQQVGLDAATAIGRKDVQLAALTLQILQATTYSAIQAVTWPS